MSSFNSTAAPLLNPLTPLAFLPPEIAYQSSITNYFTVGALAVLIWDILDNAAWDYRLHFQGKIRFNIPVVAYIVSRIGTLGILLGSAIFASAPIGNCVLLNKIFHAWCPVSISCNAFLFFLRLRAIYNRNRIVVAFFFVFWVGLSVAGVFVPLGISGGSLGPTRYCRFTSSTATASFGLIVPLVYDTPVFAAISWRLSRIASVEMGYKDSMRILFSGRGLPRFTRSLLVDGQLYYLITLITGLATFILVYTPSVPQVLRPVGINPYLAVVNIMACRVFRRTRAGLIRETEISTSVMAEEITQAHRLTLPSGEGAMGDHSAQLAHSGQPRGADRSKEPV
ncbi:hypothetical protein HYPSUDRAFT_41000 [Hypholoma sublateritium FD-334 SS-4]|uniref:G-protein coupled receptors family 1 profile domain-containing protein n=1 Tax=Hypholoma sublateritium (strain FD-334 SS-4) TaxID=945553 RepID=A0A0D2MFJ3_HYPSF|nr:hypothetical protein HYPSUDRAFT_41000 [Hypholoma sublateritium FD-334 SS-4]